MTPLRSLQCVNNGLTSVSLALAPLRFQDPIRERVNSQTDYPGVNSDVYENPIQIYANSLLSPPRRPSALSPIIGMYRERQIAAFFAAGVGVSNWPPYSYDYIQKFLKEQLER